MRTIGLTELRKHRARQTVRPHSQLNCAQSIAPERGRDEHEPADSRCKKLVQLSAARAVGLAIPETAITSQKEQLRMLAEQTPSLGADIERTITGHLMQLAGLPPRQGEGALFIPAFRNDAGHAPADSQGALLGLLFSRGSPASCMRCPAISELGVDAQLYAESQQAHSFFHRKLALSQTGEIKNAPTTRQGFGFAGKYPLRELGSTPEFRRRGTIRKDQFEGCRDCAYRHACVDPREPLLTPSGTYRHATPCPQQPRSESGDAERIS